MMSFSVERLVSDKDLPYHDHVGSGIPAEVDAFGHGPSEIVFTVPRRRGGAIGPGSAVKGANHGADRIVYLDYWSAGADRLQLDRHLPGHYARADGQTRQALNRGL